MRMFALAPEQVEQTWPDYCALIDRYERVGDMKANQVKEEAIAGRMQLWGLQDSEKVHGVVATQIKDTAKGYVCEIAMAVGDAPAGFQKRLLEEIGKWARDDQHCNVVRIQGRKGWLRRFPYFRPTGVVAEWNLRTQ